jgi:diacylglycerol kinase family enzyme
MPNAIVIFNPRAGRQRGVASGPALVEALARHGWHATLAETCRAGHATELARHATAVEGVELVVTVGGDGTIREAVGGMRDTNAKLLALAGGTANVIASGLGTGGPHLDVLARLPAMVTCRLDVGLCAGEPFLMQASAGLDAFVMREVSPFLKRHFGVAGVGLSGIACLFRYAFPTIRVTIDGVGHDCTGVIVASFPFYAGLYHLGPRVKPDDGKLDVLLFTGKGRAAATGFSLALAMGHHLRRADLEMRTATSVSIDGPADAAVQVDGDVLPNHKPVQIGMAGWRASVMCAPNAPAFALRPA